MAPLTLRQSLLSVIDRLVPLPVRKHADATPEKLKFVEFRVVPPFTRAQLRLAAAAANVALLAERPIVYVAPPLPVTGDVNAITTPTGAAMVVSQFDPLANQVTRHYRVYFEVP